MRQCVAILGIALGLGCWGIPGCSKPEPGLEILNWNSSSGETGLERVAGEPGAKGIRLVDEEATKGKRWLSVACNIRPEAIWRPGEGGTFQVTMADFHLLVPGSESVAPFAIGWSGREGYSQLPKQTSKTGTEKTFTVHFAVSPEIADRKDLQIQYGTLPAQALTEQNRAK